MSELEIVKRCDHCRFRDSDLDDDGWMDEEEIEYDDSNDSACMHCDNYGHFLIDPELLEEANRNGVTLVVTNRETSNIFDARPITRECSVRLAEGFVTTTTGTGTAYVENDN